MFKQLTSVSSFIKPHLRRHWKITLALLVIVILISLTLLIDLFSPPTTNRQLTFPLNHQNITVGQTTHDQLIDQLGVFTTQYQQDGFDVYSYASSYSTYTGDRFYLNQDRVIAKEINYNPNQFKVSVDQAATYFGSDFTKLFTPADAFNTSSTVYFYQQSGLAVYIRPDDNVVTKILYFPVISLDTFKTTWGKNLLDTQPTPPQPTGSHHQ